ncbi:MAG: chemotaxis protein CheA, partial [Jaaginema sp. PMC 1080.18]|nr:chemotaxis protein CheA [Jaaginema sp. PMC 1080.18]
MSDWWQDCEKEVLKLLGIQTIKSTQEQQKMAGNLNVEREQIYIDFLHEAQELLQIIEQELLSLREDHSTAKVHNLMRAAHTLKGSSASMELQNLSQIAHGLEGVFKSLYNPELQIDAELESLLFKAYEYLQLAVTEASLRRTQNNPKILNQAASALAAVQQKLGSYFNPDAEIPSSEELGFDIVGSIFEVGVQQRIEELERAIATGDKETISNTITAANTIFMGLAESLNLPGFGEIAQLTEIAVERYPQHILEIAPIALENLVAAQKQVLEGDREEGGQASESLRAWVLETLPEATEALFDASTTIDIDCAQMWDLAPETVAVPESKNGSDRASEPSIDSIFGNISTNDLEEFGHFDSIPEETETVDFSSQIEPVEDIDPILEPASTPIETENPNPPTPVPLSNSHQTVRVEVDRLEQLNFQAGELLIEQNNRVVQNDLMLGAWRDLRSRMQQHAKTLNRLLSWQLSQVETQWVSQGLTRFSSNEGLSSPHLTHLDSLELEQYSELRLLLQKAQEEMVQMEECAEGLDLFTRSSHQTLQKQQRLLKTVQDNLTWARMQEFGSTLERLERLVQQLHHQHQKEVEFSLEGAKVPIDKAIAQNLYDPLLHLVRNAFAHGIESPEERTQQGKPAVGRITIRAYNQGNRTFIEVKDDGRGIDYPKIRDRALERNLITATQNLTPQELHNLIFTPGFSTAPDVDDLRGRGVGLDVVQSYITAINATLAVHTQAQQGTTFTIRLPLTLSIAKLIVCQVGKLAYAVPADSIDQIILLQPHQVKQIGPQRVLQWQKSRSNGKTSPEQTLPLYRLGDLIHYTSPLVP